MNVINTQIANGKLKPVYAIRSDARELTMPRPLKIINRGIAAAIGGIIRVERIQSAIKFSPRSLKLTKPKAIGIAKIRQNMVDLEASSCNCWNSMDWSVVLF